MCTGVQSYVPFSLTGCKNNMGIISGVSFHRIMYNDQVRTNNNLLMLRPDDNEIYWMVDVVLETSHPGK